MKKGFSNVAACGVTGAGSTEDCGPAWCTSGWPPRPVGTVQCGRLHPRGGGGRCRLHCRSGGRNGHIHCLDRRGLLRPEAAGGAAGNISLARKFIARSAAAALSLSTAPRAAVRAAQNGAISLYCASVASAAFSSSAAICVAVVPVVSLAARTASGDGSVIVVIHVSSNARSATAARCSASRKRLVRKLTAISAPRRSPGSRRRQ